MKGNSLTILSFFLLVIHCSAQWTPEVNITPGSVSAGMNENAYPCLAVNGNNLHVVFTDRHAAGAAVYYVQSTDSGNTWSVPKAISDTAGHAWMVANAVSGDTIHVVWMDTLNGIRASCYKRSTDNGITWSNTLVLDSNTAFWPGIAADGAFVVATLNKRSTSTNTEVWVVTSTDGGTTWNTEQQVTNADGRSEDPAVAVTGQQIHLSWNDKRTGVMEIWYKHSMDGGSTWSTDTPVTSSDSYSSMVSVDGNYVDVPCGLMVIPHFHVYMAQSVDTGFSFAPSHEVTTDTLGDIYPFLTRRNMDLFLSYAHFSSPAGPMYTHSADGGINWDPPFYLGGGGQAFLGITGCAIHAVFVNSGHIGYRRNPTAVCNPLGISKVDDGTESAIYPNPVTSELIVRCSGDGIVSLYDISGKTIAKQKVSFPETRLCTENLAPGLYFLKVEKGACIKNYKIVKAVGLQ